MITFGLDIYKREKIDVSVLDDAVHHAELEGFEGVLNIRESVTLQHICIPIGYGIDPKAVEGTAVAVLKVIRADLDKTIEIIEKQTMPKI